MDTIPYPGVNWDAIEREFDMKMGFTHIDGSLLHVINIFENAFMP